MPPEGKPLLGVPAAPLARNAAREAATLLREAILDGRLKPGQRLKERELADQFGLSRTPIREALLLLESEGTVVVLSKRGATVRTYSVDQIEETYDLRAILEAYACRRAAGRIRPEAVARLKDINTRFAALESGRDVEALMKENQLFHQAIFDAAESDRLHAMIRGVTEVPLVYRSFLWYSDEQKRASEHYHAQITRALELHDAERAELVMREHIYEARDLVIARLQQEPGAAEEAG